MHSSPAAELREAARYLRLLHSAERAHCLGDEEQLVSLFSGVDPIDVHALASTLEVLALSTGTEPTPSAALPSSRDDESTDGASTPGSSVPVTYLWHAGDNWSKKVPCE